MMIRKKSAGGLLIAALLWASPVLSGTPLSSRVDGKIVAGFLEKVTIGSEALVFKAKLDTGARNSSLNAENIRMFRRGGAQWVSFSVTDHTGKTLHLEKETVRVAEIKMRDETLQPRPVIMVPICMGTIVKDVEINLVDRSFFNYQVLIGRSYLKDDFLVDAAATYLLSPNACLKKGNVQ